MKIFEAAELWEAADLLDEAARIAPVGFDGYRAKVLAEMLRDLGTEAVE